MDIEQTGQLMLRIKGCWFRQPADDPTIAVWHEILQRIEARDAQAAVAMLIRSERAEPPTPGVVYQLALKIGADREELRRSQIRLLPEPKPSPEEIARVKAIVAECVSKIGRSMLSLREISEAEKGEARESK